MLKINKVTVIGANGTMGCNVAAIFASFGNAKVNMVCRNEQLSLEATVKASKSVKAGSIKNNLIARTYEDLEECILESDLIFESVSENLELKQEMNKKIQECVKENTIIATGTSGLSINTLSEYFDNEIKKQYLGLHFYNPPYNMTLCEVIPSKHTDLKLVSVIKNYLETVLYRNVVEIKDTPAFLGNRVGFQFINEALQYAVKFKDNGGIDYIDAILGTFTGRSMPPLVTSDFVGLDVHKAIVDNIYDNTHDYTHETFKMPEFSIKLINEKKLGRKVGCGFYQTLILSANKKTHNVYDIGLNEYRPVVKYNFDFAEKMKKNFRIGNYKQAFEALTTNKSLEADICLEFIIKYVIYSIVITKEIGDNIHASDIVMATGFNWVPPLSVIDAFGGRDKFLQIVKDRLENHDIRDLDLHSLFYDIPKSRYDYRTFFKAK